MNPTLILMSKRVRLFHRVTQPFCGRGIVLQGDQHKVTHPCHHIVRVSSTQPHTPWWGGCGSPWQRALSRPARAKASARTGPPNGLPLESADRGVMLVLLELASRARGPGSDRLTLVYTMRGVTLATEALQGLLNTQNYHNFVIVGKRLCTDVCKRGFNVW